MTAAFALLRGFARRKLLFFARPCALALRVSFADRALRVQWGKQTAARRKSLIVLITRSKKEPRQKIRWQVVVTSARKPGGSPPVKTRPTRVIALASLWCGMRE